MSSSSQFSDCDWFYHIPRKPNQKKSQVQLPPTSQIPGLSDLAEPHKEITFDSRRLWIRDTDSDYVKLAKQGGRADLLRHYSPPLRMSPPIPCLQPEWFTHAPPSTKTKEVPKWYLPEYMVHEEFIPSPSDNKSERIPHDSDKTTLEKEAEDNEKENEAKVKLKLPEIMDKKQRNKWFTKKTVEGENKFPTMPLPKKNEPINFTKLMANGYAEDLIQQQKEWKKLPPKIKEPGDAGKALVCQEVSHLLKNIQPLTFSCSHRICMADPAEFLFWDVDDGGGGERDSEIIIPLNVKDSKTCQLELRPADKM